MRAAALALLELENRPLRIPGAVGDRRSWPMPVAFSTVAGAWVDRVVAGDPALAGAYARAARAAVDHGATVVAASCGFAVVFQAAMEEAVDVPVVSSALLALPGLLRRHRDGAVAVVTYDATAIGARHWRAAGVTPADARRIVTAGLDGTPSGRALAQPEPEPEVTLSRLARDVSGAVERLSARGDMRAVVLECTATLPVRDRVAVAAGVPVVGLHDVVAGVRRRHAAASSS